MKISFLIAILFFIQFSSAQEKRLYGKISANGNNVEGINIVNLVNEKTTVSNENGEFYILAKEDDLLVLSAVNLEYKRKIITSDDMKATVLTIEMIPKVGQLEEVVITQYKNINAVDLGLLSKPAKVYTPAERKVRTATTGLLDPLLNLMSGRTKRLKQLVSIEAKELLVEKLSDLYDDEFYTEDIKIKKDKIAGFKYFAVEDTELPKAVKEKNKTLTTFILTQLAIEFNELQANEK